jgi:hypothetical protein
VGAWYWIGVSAGLGVAVGTLVAAAVGPSVRVVLATSGAAALLAGVGLGFGIDEWKPGGWGDIALGALGGFLGLLGAAQIVSGALRRGGTRGGTATLVAGAAVAVAGLAWIPAAGYVIAAALPLLALRLRRAQPDRYAGLRTLARDE